MQIGLNRIGLHLLLPVFLGTIGLVVSAGNLPCTYLAVDTENSIPYIHPMSVRGCYCLGKNVRQRLVWRTYERTRPNLENGFFLRIDESNTSLDLKNHSVISDFTSLQGRGQNGVTGGRGRRRGIGRYVTPRRVSVRNGNIVLAGISNGVTFPEMALTGSIWSDVPTRSSENAASDRLGDTPDAVTDYVRNRLSVNLKDEDTLITIDNMTIKVGLTGITIMGRKNTVRNSRIEVTNPRAGIYLFGANNLIENNILIFKGEGLNDSAAPIKLHAASGTIIRNNIIIIESSTPRQAVSLIESSGVVLSNNRVYGASRLVRGFDNLSSFDSNADRLFSANAQPGVNNRHRRADEVGRR